MEKQYELNLECENCNLNYIEKFPWGRQATNVERFCPYCGCESLTIKGRIENNNEK